MKLNELLTKLPTKHKKEAFSSLGTAFFEFKEMEKKVKELRGQLGYDEQ